MSIEVKPLTIHMGAEISGADITRPLADEDVKGIWDALLKWRVVVFRDQKMTHGEQVAFARTFGDLTIGHAVFGHVDGYPEVYSVAKEQMGYTLQARTQEHPSLDRIPRRYYGGT